MLICCLCGGISILQVKKPEHSQTLWVQGKTNSYDRYRSSAAAS